MSNAATNDALKELLLKMADDQLILGHRYSEWIGIGPVIEEDIAFGSLAQDKVGHAYNLYQILNKELGEADPDQLAFGRKENEYLNCHLAEMPTSDYAFNLVRHFLFDHAEFIRFDLLSNSSFAPLAHMARKYRAEIKYHVFHGDTWIRQLAKGNEESRSRIQSALNEAYPLAYGIFEEGPNEQTLISENIFAGEAKLKALWKERVDAIITEAGLQVPQVSDASAGLGGRRGFHTEHLKPLVEEMTEVFRTSPEAEW